MRFSRPARLLVPYLLAREAYRIGGDAFVPIDLGKQIFEAVRGEALRRDHCPDRNDLIALHHVTGLEGVYSLAGVLNAFFFIRTSNQGSVLVVDRDRNRIVKQVLRERDKELRKKPVSARIEEEWHVYQEGLVSQSESWLSLARGTLSESVRRYARAELRRIVDELGAADPRLEAVVAYLSATAVLPRTAA